MNTTKQEVNQKILDTTTHLQADLEATLEYVVEQAGSKFRLERIEEFYQRIEDTKQLLERLKNRYI